MRSASKSSIGTLRATFMTPTKWHVLRSRQRNRYYATGPGYGTLVAEFRLRLRHFSIPDATKTISISMRGANAFGMMAVYFDFSP
jgi:hypothetical protein